MLTHKNGNMPTQTILCTSTCSLHKKSIKTRRVPCCVVWELTDLSSDQPSGVSEFHSWEASMENALPAAFCTRGCFFELWCYCTRREGQSHGIPYHIRLLRSKPSLSIPSIDCQCRPPVTISQLQSIWYWEKSLIFESWHPRCYIES